MFIPKIFWLAAIDVRKLFIFSVIQMTFYVNFAFKIFCVHTGGLHVHNIHSIKARDENRVERHCS